MDTSQTLTRLGRWVEKSQDMDEAVETFGGVRYQLLSYGAFYEADVHWKAQVNKKRAPVL